ncbi:MAG: uroporphyrinogen decarboxylase [Calditrichaeota bacterium]|nr:MAG: uroporphyrinogen decarboxylase [Calditrichota bacterium]
MNRNLKNDLLLRACRKQFVPRTPIWIMRQAGRYLPEYQKIRARYDFHTMVHTPELATKITLQPVDILDVDAAIIFSDILVVPEALGMKLKFVEGHGPVFEKPLHSSSEFDRLPSTGVQENLDFVFQAIQLVKQELNGRIPLIGFAGAPWTLAAYMVEGHASKNFARIKSLRYADPELLRKLLHKLSRAVTEFLKGQIDAGADVVQIFDSWAGVLTPEDFREFSLPFLYSIIQSIKASYEVPVILFARGAAHSYEILAEIGIDVLSISWTDDLGEIRKNVNGRIALQGNLDPCALFAPVHKIREEVVKVLKKAGSRKGHIFNLGHGILPQTPVMHAKAMVDFVKEESTKLYTDNPISFG